MKAETCSMVGKMWVPPANLADGSEVTMMKPFSTLLIW